MIRELTESIGLFHLKLASFNVKDPMVATRPPKTADRLSHTNSLIFQTIQYYEEASKRFDDEFGDLAFQI